MALFPPEILAAVLPWIWITRIAKSGLLWNYLIRNVKIPLIDRNTSATVTHSVRQQETHRKSSRTDGRPADDGERTRSSCDSKRQPTGMHDSRRSATEDAKWKIWNAPFLYNNIGPTVTHKAECDRLMGVILTGALVSVGLFTVVWFGQNLMNSSHVDSLPVERSYLPILLFILFFFKAVVLCCLTRLFVKYFNDRSTFYSTIGALFFVFLLWICSAIYTEATYFQAWVPFSISNGLKELEDNVSAHVSSSVASVLCWIVKAATPLLVLGISFLTLVCADHQTGSPLEDSLPLQLFTHTNNNSNQFGKNDTHVAEEEAAEIHPAEYAYQNLKHLRPSKLESSVKRFLVLSVPFLWFRRSATRLQYAFGHSCHVELFRVAITLLMIVMEFREIPSLLQLYAIRQACRAHKIFRNETATELVAGEEFHSSNDESNTQHSQSESKKTISETSQLEVSKNLLFGLSLRAFELLLQKTLLVLLLLTFWSTCGWEACFPSKKCLQFSPPMPRISQFSPSSTAADVCLRNVTDDGDEQLTESIDLSSCTDKQALHEPYTSSQRSKDHQQQCSCVPTAPVFHRVKHVLLRRSDGPRSLGQYEEDEKATYPTITNKRNDILLFRLLAELSVIFFPASLTCGTAHVLLVFTLLSHAWSHFLLSSVYRIFSPAIRLQTAAAAQSSQAT